MKSPPIDATEASAAPQWCAVYDHRRTGKVVHVHELIPADPQTPCAKDALAQEALRIAAHEHPDADLQVIHPPASVKLDSRANFRIDAKSRKLVVERADVTGPTRIGSMDKRRSRR